MTPVSTEEFRRRFSEWLRYVEIDATWFSREEWVARKEPMMRTAPLHLIHESEALYDDVFEKTMHRLLETLGWWYARGYAWSMHFYPIALNS